MKKFKHLREAVKKKQKETDELKPIPDVEGQTYFDFEGAKKRAEEEEARKAKQWKEKLDDEAFDKETLYGRRGR